MVSFFAEFVESALKSVVAVADHGYRDRYETHYEVGYRYGVVTQYQFSATLGVQTDSQVSASTEFSELAIIRFLSK